MNPRQKALKVFEQQAIAMRNMEDPISPIEQAIHDTRQETLQEIADLAESKKSLILDEFRSEIILLKGKISF